ncbi:NAD-dependent epimerase/dehydratase [Pseudomonas saudimassiliensis]|uniref:NAD-dependent epimerase/dehydratase n=1 Tax=Pseudomonas saudimassiliensis TaxID=1461581 RepID=A0A078M8A4_9PSED|nr:SDR family oxidoreductase [Pseudomonas saudimassiliensis]CEA00901.1 NAD-dependent epimerase/dehydratase [Pseudomonas saudimassiliensis]CEF25318.1 NAD-dependent epimerase/dehydratase [Pseudomonas saudimassiliensis]
MTPRILITGAAGYIGHQLGNRLAADLHVVGTDLHPRDDVQFPIQVMDIRDPALAELLQCESITHVVHLASILQASPDRQRDYDIDVNGTRNVLECCLKSGVSHLTITSSGAAYGYHPDNPAWIDEQDPLRGNPEFAYSDHKRQIEELLADYRQRHPALRQLVLRPGTVLGAETRNQITELFMAPRLLALKGSDSPFVFIWDQDVISAMELGLRQSRTGIYNMAGDGALSMTEIAARLNKPVRRLPVWLVKIGLQLAQWRGKPTSPAQVKFLQYRPVLSNRRLKEEFGYTPRKTSAETLDYFAQCSGARRG